MKNNPVHTVLQGKLMFIYSSFLKFLLSSFPAAPFSSVLFSSSLRNPASCSYTIEQTFVILQVKCDCGKIYRSMISWCRTAVWISCSWCHTLEPPLLFTDDVVLVASSGAGLQLTLQWFVAISTVRPWSSDGKWQRAHFRSGTSYCPKCRSVSISASCSQVWREGSSFMYRAVNMFMSAVKLDCKVLTLEFIGIDSP